MSCSVVSRGRRGTSSHVDVFGDVWKILLCGRRNTFATFSEHALHVLWQAQHFGRVQLHFSWQAQHFRRVVLRVFCESQWHANCVADKAIVRCEEKSQKASPCLWRKLQNLRLRRCH